MTDATHRVGKMYKLNGKTSQDVLLCLTSWNARNNIYQKRKELPFMIYPDLTNRRDALLDFAKDVTKNDLKAQDVVKFVFCDNNCKMKVFSKTENFFAFNSEVEFLNIVSRLDQEASASQDFLIDENEGRPDFERPYDLYY